MSNKRVTELNEIFASGSSAQDTIATDDYFLVSDISEVESKKIKATELQTYANQGTASYAAYAGTASYAHNANSASYAPMISASYALSSSYADWAKTASFVISASYAFSSSYSFSSSYAVTASYSETSSVQLVISSGMATQALSASYLIYLSGSHNGTASYAINSNWARSALTASYLFYDGVNPTGTASYALTTPAADTASFLYYDGSPNGTSSYAWKSNLSVNAETASIAQSTNNSYLFREFDIATSSIVSAASSTTASIGWVQLTGSPVPRISVEAWGDVVVPQTSDANNSSSLTLLMEGTAQYFELDTANVINYFTGSSLQDTGSRIQSFNLKGQFNASSTTERYSGSVLASNGLTFSTASRDVQFLIKANTDNFVNE